MRPGYLNTRQGRFRHGFEPGLGLNPRPNAEYSSDEIGYLPRGCSGYLQRNHAVTITEVWFFAREPSLAPNGTTGLRI